MANELLPWTADATGLRRGPGEAERLVSALCSHPVAVRHAALFKARILHRLIAGDAEPNAIDWHTEHGDFVFGGLRSKLSAALDSLDVTAEPGSGAVLLSDRYVVANLHMPEASEYGRAARHGLFNTNMLYPSHRPVLTPYRALEGYVSPGEVHGDEPAPSFELTDGEALAAEAELVVRSLLATRDCAASNRGVGRMDAFSAGVSDMYGILGHIRGLLLRLDAFAEPGTLPPAPPKASA